jgi:hypothetical protein
MNTITMSEENPISTLTPSRNELAGRMEQKQSASASATNQAQVSEKETR